MTVFISHSFDNHPEFENVTDWLDRLGVPYWKPAELKSAASLRDQLRHAVRSCSVCIFVATHDSVSSSWCGAELGAFWGAGTPVIVYLADSSLSEEALPPILQGDVWDRKLSRVAERAAELVAQRSGTATISPDDRITNMTVEQLQKTIAGAISLFLAGEQRGVTSSEPDGEPGAAALDAAERMLRATDATNQISHEPSDDWRRRVLWVDDRPDNNTYERDAFELLGLDVDLSLTTDGAMEQLSTTRYGAIISDMGRPEGPREGYALLDRVRESDTATPFFVYAGSNAPEHRREATERGAQGCTNRADELVAMVTEALGSNIGPDDDQG